MMTQDLKLTIIQADLHWEDSGANLAMFEEKIWQISEPTDVVVLPEMFSTGFSMDAPRLAEMMNMRTFKWMKQMAEHTGALVLGSFIARVHDRFYNRLLWMEPTGSFKIYDKRHLFRIAEEQRVFSPGESLLIGTWKGWRICPLVCYDLRFPVWSRNQWNPALKKLAYDVLVYVANWPRARGMAWETLLKARAIENLSYVAGVNRIGIDGKGIEYNGHSTVINPKGESIFAVEGTEIVRTIALDGAALQSHREKFPTYLDADDFTLEIGQFETRTDE